MQTFDYKNCHCFKKETIVTHFTFDKESLSEIYIIMLVTQLGKIIEKDFLKPMFYFI